MQMAVWHAALERVLRVNTVFLAIAIAGSAVLATTNYINLPLARLGWVTLAAVAFQSIVWITLRARLARPDVLAMIFFAGFSAFSLYVSRTVSAFSGASIVSFLYPALAIASGFELGGSLLLLSIVAFRLLVPLMEGSLFREASSFAAGPASQDVLFTATALLFAASVAFVGAHRRRSQSFLGRYREHVESLSALSSPIAAARGATRFLHNESPLKFGIFIRRPDEPAYQLVAGSRDEFRCSVHHAVPSRATESSEVDLSEFERAFFPAEQRRRHVFLARYETGDHQILALASKDGAFLPEEFYLVDDVFHHLKGVMEATLLKSHLERNARVVQAYERAERLIARTAFEKDFAPEILGSLRGVYNASAVVILRVREDSPALHVVSRAGNKHDVEHILASARDLLSSAPTTPHVVELGTKDGTARARQAFLIAHSPLKLGKVALVVAIVLTRGKRLQPVDFDNVQRLSAAVAFRVEALENHRDAERARTVLSLALDAYPDPVAIVDRDGRIEIGNAALVSLFSEIERAHLVSGEALNLFALIPALADDAALASLDTGETAPPHAQEIEIQRRSGARRYFVRAFPFRLENEQSRFFLLFEDVTVVSQMKQELSVTRRFAQVGELASYVTHNINNALSNIVALAHLTSLDYPAARESLKQIIDQAMQIRDTVQKSLSFAAAHRITAETFNASDVVERAVGLYSVKARAEGVRLDTTFNHDFEIKGQFDAILQALSNIVDNAIDAASLRYGDRRVAVTVERIGNRGVISVEDNGPGIAPELRERIFDPFFTTKGSSGTGLGLAFAKRVLEEAGARLELESTVGKGTVFRIVFPEASELGSSNNA